MEVITTAMMEKITVEFLEILKFFIVDITKKTLQMSASIYLANKNPRVP